MLDGDAPWVDSPNISKYPIIYTKLVKFEDVKLEEDCSEDETGFSSLKELQEELVRRCNAMFDNGCDLPECNYVIDMVDLSKTEEYKNYAVLEDIGLGDTIHCTYKPLGIMTDARVIRIKYDCILEKNIEEELGNAKFDYFGALDNNLNNIQSNVDSAMDAASDAQNVANGAQSTADDALQAATDAIDANEITYENLMAILNSDGTVRGDVVKGVLNAFNVQMKYQKDVSHKADVRAVLFEDTDPSSSTYGALSIGTLGLQIADSRTTDGKNWNWKTAITAKGGIADIFVLGTMLADRIKGGTLTLGSVSNQNGKITMLDDTGRQIGYWDKDGLVASKGTFGGSLQIGHRYVVTHTGLTYVYHPQFVYSIAMCTDFLPDINNKLEDAEYEIVVYHLLDGLHFGSTSDATYITGSEVTVTGDTGIYGNLGIIGSMTATGTKSRLVATENYAERLQYCYEMANPIFGDIGEGVIDKTGKCYISIDDIFGETVSLDRSYYVFLQKEGSGDLWVSEKTQDYFVVEGTPGLKFDWELKARQKGFEMERLDPVIDKTINEPDYAGKAATMVENYYKKMEDINL